MKATWLLVLPNGWDAAKQNIWCKVAVRVTPLQPKGLEASVTRTTNTAAVDKFTWQELLTLKHSIDPAYRNGGRFRLVFNDNTLKMLSEMEDAQKRPLWLPEIVGVAPSTVLNIPYVIDPAIADIGKGKKFIYCGDFNRFIVRRVSTMTLSLLLNSKIKLF